MNTQCYVVKNTLLHAAFYLNSPVGINFCADKNTREQNETEDTLMIEISAGIYFREPEKCISQVFNFAKLTKIREIHEKFVPAKISTIKIK